MGHKHEIEVYVMVDEAANLSVEEQCAFFKDKLQKYACMMDIVQEEYEKAYLEVRRTRGLPVYSDTMFKEEIPKATAPAEEMAVFEPAAEETVMESESMPEMVMPEPEPEPEPEPFVPETIEEHANAVLESIEAMDIPAEVPAVDVPMAEIPVELPVAEVPVEMEMPVAAEIPVEVPVAEMPEMPVEMPAMETAPAVEAVAPVVEDVPPVPAASETPVEMSPDEIAAMLAAAQATA